MMKYEYRIINRNEKETTIIKLIYYWGPNSCRQEFDGFEAPKSDPDKLTSWVVAARHTMMAGCRRCPVGSSAHWPQKYQHVILHAFAGACVWSFNSSCFCKAHTRHRCHKIRNVNVWWLHIESLMTLTPESSRINSGHIGKHAKGEEYWIPCWKIRCNSAALPQHRG